MGFRIVAGPNLQLLIDSLNDPVEHCKYCGWRSYPHKAKDLAPRSRRDQAKLRPDGHNYLHTLMNCPGYSPDAKKVQPQ